MRLKLAALACASTAATLMIGLAPAASAASIAPTLLEAGNVRVDRRQRRQARAIGTRHRPSYSRGL
ncbi:hypothetical protein [Actinacidiphila soli]|uniref:hypothetical protein n=1 Tax=Actinacidiphila soli TaxID=2487275 RepID=UPI000FCC50AB|nr:hypothetical protein [Actinacidiphila soli]